MVRVLAARIAKLGELETSGGGSLVLGGGIVPVLAHRALQADDLAHWISLVWPATSAGKQRAILLRRALTRRDAGLGAPAARYLSCETKDERSGHARSTPIIHESTAFEKRLSSRSGFPQKPTDLGRAP